MLNRARGLISKPNPAMITLPRTNVVRVYRRPRLNRMKRALIGAAIGVVAGALLGNLFMSLIHTCQLCDANSFDYLVELQRHARELAARPAEWMPWSYRETLARLAV